MAYLSELLPSREGGGTTPSTHPVSLPLLTWPQQAAHMTTASSTRTHYFDSLYDYQMHVHYLKP
jgi:hypothetical protein